MLEEVKKKGSFQPFAIHKLADGNSSARQKTSLLSGGIKNNPNAIFFPSFIPRVSFIN
jgi:hypothetical protein